MARESKTFSIIPMMKRESETIEFKESWRDEYLRWICAFANTQGGKLYLGINDDGKVVGLKDAKRLMEDLPNKIASVLGIVCEVKLLSEEGKDYIEIDVAPSNMPIPYHGKYEVRSGSTKQELKGAALQDFLMRKMGLSWDDAVCEQATLEDIDRKAIDYFLFKAVDAGRLPSDVKNDSTEQVLRNLDLMTKEGRLKNAAVLLFAHRPQRFFTCVTFCLGRFGVDEADLMFQDRIEGNLVQMADRVMEVLRSKYLIAPIHYVGMQRREPLEIPEDALREAIYNAIVHKDYTGVHIQMKIYNDKIVLWNSGVMPHELNERNIYVPHPSYPRNKHLADAFYLMGFIETWGRGLHKICTLIEDAKQEHPLVEPTPEGLRVTFFRPRVDMAGEATEKNLTVQESVQENVQEMSKKILALIRENNSITQTALAKILGVTPKTIYRKLARLQAAGRLRRIGPDKGGHWEVS